MDAYDVALQVIDGVWGNNEDRKIALTRAGYNYDEVQRYVNDILQGKTIERIKEIEIDVRGYTGLKIELVVD